VGLSPAKGGGDHLLLVQVMDQHHIHCVPAARRQTVDEVSSWAKVRLCIENVWRSPAVPKDSQQHQAEGN
jgi:hypothetical protein